MGRGQQDGNEVRARLARHGWRNWGRRFARRRPRCNTTPTNGLVLELSWRKDSWWQKLTKREMARCQRRNMRPQVSLGSEDCVLAFFKDATSLEKACFSSTTEVVVTSFSPAGTGSAHALAGGMLSLTGRIRRACVFAGRMGVIVDAGLLTTESSIP
jgi:hypothetical protein